ncbi:DNA polymerase III subunit delta' [Rubinisphaera sp. JC750]|uniref:DNA polymerase III subunit delta' n=1 Tax=Rubinisphaera sp. JC750 TaxID=2898658 RepID=UPI001F0153A4|nr:DNA polymerase III subunit delta' [Rubinisphaera sp. JC750]
MGWEQYYGHEQKREMFARALQRGRLGHAYLFVGPSGIGKRSFARLLAQSLLCTRRPDGELTACGECSGCRQVLTRNHPDLMEVGLPEGKSELPIDVFVGSPERRGREGLCHELSLSAMQGGYRIAIIDDADRMNIASANALLKTLEEPGPGAVLILIAEDADQVIQTIRSRCQQLYFGPLNENDLRKAVEDQLARQEPGESQLPLETVLAGAHGSVEQALGRMNRSPDFAAAEKSLQDMLARPQWTAARLSKAAEPLLSQFGSDTSAQREGAHAVVGCCLKACYRQLVGGATAGLSDWQRDHWADAVDLCLETGIQIDRRATVALCLDAFFQELEIRLRPTWNPSPVRS